MSALSSLVTQVGYELGMTIGAATQPSTTDVTQWLKDAQRLLLLRLPPHLLGSCLVSEEKALATTTYATITYNAIKLLPSVFYDYSQTKYVDCKLVTLAEYKVLSSLATDLSMVDAIISYDDSNKRVYVYPAGEVTNDKILCTYASDVNTASTDFVLSVVAEPAAVYFAACIASLQSEDLQNMANKFFLQYENAVKSLGGI